MKELHKLNKKRDRAIRDLTKRQTSELEALQKALASKVCGVVAEQSLSCTACVVVERGHVVVGRLCVTLAPSFPCNVSLALSTPFPIWCA